MDLIAKSHHHRSNALRLTPELVALIARKVEDGGPAPGVVVPSEADYEASLQALLAASAWQGEDVWVFAYGSLLWNPAFDVAEQAVAVLHGWHRAFCIRATRFAVPNSWTDDVAGSGGSCRGALCRVAGDRVLRACVSMPRNDRQAAKQSATMGGR
jgi:cation transport protein ChaC